MKAFDIYRQLCCEQWWASQRQAVRWVASRYYSGVESVYELKDRAVRSLCLDNRTLAPVLTQEEVADIIRLR